MRIYIDRDEGSEYSATDLYEDWFIGGYMVEAEMSDADWLEGNRITSAYWKFQDKLHELYDAGRRNKKCGQ
jgi:hypothetical protein